MNVLNATDEWNFALWWGRDQAGLDSACVMEYQHSVSDAVCLRCEWNVGFLIQSLIFTIPLLINYDFRFVFSIFFSPLSSSRRKRSLRSLPMGSQCWRRKMLRNKTEIDDFSKSAYFLVFDQKEKKSVFHLPSHSMHIIVINLKSYDGGQWPTQEWS